MDFYELWAEARKTGACEDSFFEMFLSETEASKRVFNVGTDGELTIMARLLLDSPIQEFIDKMSDTHDKITANRIVQFSDLQKAIQDVNRALYFAERPLTFVEIGNVIIEAKTEGANKKYGENHSKLALELDMVRFDKKGSTTVTNTRFGNYLFATPMETKIELTKRLILRNPFIQYLLYRANTGFVSYQSVAKPYISLKTMERRRSNNMNLVELIVCDTPKKYILDQIDWSLEVEDEL